MIRGRTPKAVSAIRKAQRAHAKKRFEQRFALKMNRHHIHEIEKKIASGQVVLIERRQQVRNYFVGIAGRLIAVGYNTFTKRVVTALPDRYVEKLPAGLIHVARLLLLKDETGVIGDIVSGRNCRLLHRQDEAVSHYVLQYPGLSLKTGYDCRTNQLVPYVKPSAAGRLPCKLPPPERFELLDLDPAVCEQIARKIRSGESTFIWRYSKTLTFREVQLGEQIFRVGYTAARGALYRYEDPSEADW